MRFSLGVNYWPRRSATAMWQRFDAGEIGADFAQIAALGLDTVRFFLRWDAFAPQPDRIDGLMLDRLETVMSLAGDNGLRALPVLFCGHAHGANYLPDWALDRHAPRGRFRTFTGERESAFGCGDLYRGALLEAQLVFARAAAQRLRAHPALFAWDIGHRFSDVREPSHAMVTSGEHSKAPADEAVVANWSRRLTHALREADTVPVTAGTFSGDLTTDRSIRLGSLCVPFGFASMQGDTVSTAIARNRLDPEVMPFLAMLTAAFSLQPVLVTGFGNRLPAGQVLGPRAIRSTGRPAAVGGIAGRSGLRHLPVPDRRRTGIHGCERARSAARRRPARRVLVVLGRLSRRHPQLRGVRRLRP